MTMGERILLVVLVAAMGGLMLSGFAFYRYSWEVIRFPAITAAATVPLCILALLSIGTRRSEQAPAQQENDSGVALEKVVPFLARIAVAVPAVLALGYAIGLSVYLLFHLRQNGETWRLAVVLSLGCFAFIYFVLNIALGRPFDAGLFNLVL